MPKSAIVVSVTGGFCLLVASFFIFHLNDAFIQNKTKNFSNMNINAGLKGLKIEDIKIGDGEDVKKGDTVSIHYLGTLLDGTKFDSSYDRGQAFETQIGVGQVIEGWDLGVVGMKVGGKRKLTISPELGYGSQSMGPIPANSTLIFEVELVGIN